LGTICHTCGGWAHRPHLRYTGSPGPADGSNLRAWSSTRLDGLYFCETVLTPFPAGAQLPSVAAVALPWYGVLWTAGRSCWAVLISSYRTSSTSDLAMIHMMSVKYAFSLSLVFCLDSASDAVCSQARGLNQPGQGPLTDTAGPHCRHSCLTRRPAD
jgi:hypothetical protein